MLKSLKTDAGHDESSDSKKGVWANLGKVWKLLE